MSRQAPRPSGTARLFLAVWPPDHVVEALVALRRKDQRGVRFVPPDDWHVTLRFLGQERVEAVVDALDGAGPLPPAHARLGPGVDVMFGRAVVVPVRGVDLLAAAVIAPTRHLGEPPRLPFAGHLTLARLHKGAGQPPVVGALVGGEFDVGELALVESRLQPDRARYSTVHSWPVGPQSPAPPAT